MAPTALERALTGLRDLRILNFRPRTVIASALGREMPLMSNLNQTLNKNRTSRSILWSLLLASALVLAPGSAPLRAEIDFAASLSIPLGDDGRVFINLASNHYHADPDVVVYASTRLGDPVNELPVALFIATEANRPVRAVLELRLGGESWNNIFVSFGLPYSGLFAELPADPGPPYGKAWGYWKKHKKQPSARIVLSDTEFTDLVHLHVTTRALGIDAREAIRLRAKGSRFDVIAGNAYRAKHAGKNAGKSKGKGQGAQKGKPKNKGKSSKP